MGLVEGIQHLTFLSEDLDRLAGFYGRVFEAEKTLDLTEEGFRHVFLKVGPATVLHPFQILEGRALPPAPGTMFDGHGSRGTPPRTAPGARSGRCARARTSCQVRAGSARPSRI